MGNADCGLQIEVPYLQFIFSIRNPKSEIPITPILHYSTYIQRQGLQAIVSQDIYTNILI